MLRRAKQVLRKQNKSARTRSHTRSVLSYLLSLKPGKIFQVSYPNKTNITLEFETVEDVYFNLQQSILLIIVVGGFETYCFPWNFH